jgi:hypothetical protein
MAYSTLFWNRWVKDLSVANTLSLGWQLGFIREYGGGMLDVGQAMTTRGGLVTKARRGDLDRPLFVTFYTTQALAYGGLLTWAMTGQSPQDLMDYVYPRTGETKPDGTPERATTMFYPREFMAIYKHMQNEGKLAGLGHVVENKASGVVGLVKEAVTGVNSFGQEIRDPDGDFYKQLDQTVRNTLINLEPITTKSAREGEPSTKKSVLAFTGFGAAPKYITESKTEGTIKSLYDKYEAPKQTPYDRAQFSQEMREIHEAYQLRKMAEVREKLTQLQIDFELTSKEMRKLQKGLGKQEDPMLKKFGRLTWKLQKKVLDQATPEERKKLLPASNKEHLRYRYRPPKEESNE